MKLSVLCAVYFEYPVAVASNYCRLDSAISPLESVIKCIVVYRWNFYCYYCIVVAGVEFISQVFSVVYYF
jgi:hypothetical protein